MQMKVKISLTGLLLGTNHACITTNHYRPESKGDSIQWKHPSSPSTKEFKATPLAGKVMLNVFCYSQGVLLAHFQKHGENVNAASYYEVLLKLRDSIRRKLRGQLARGILLHHNNAWPHTAQATKKRIQGLQWERLEHQP
jgi:hypothetical protein